MNKKALGQLQDDHDMLITIAANVEFIKGSLAAGATKMNKFQSDIEEINRWRFKEMGKAIGVATLMSAIIAILTNLVMNSK